VLLPFLTFLTSNLRPFRSTSLTASADSLHLNGGVLAIDQNGQKGTKWGDQKVVSASQLRWFSGAVATTSALGVAHYTLN